MVHIHADASDPNTSTVGTSYTFYGRYGGGSPWDAADHLQPLPTNFNARYLNGNFFAGAQPAASAPAFGAGPAGPPTGSTALIVWRDSKVSQQYFTCGNLPAPYPLPQEDITAFDDQEHPQGVLNGNTFT